MNNFATNETKITPKETFWMELEWTKSGHEKLSCRLNGKHYVGFLSRKERKNRMGEVVGDYKIAKMRVCDWEGCLVCFPQVMV